LLPARPSAARAARPPVRTSYTRRLLDDRNLRLKKLGEESTELAVALADGDAQRAVDETADLVYHVLTALRALGVGIDEVRGVLERRAGLAQEATEPTASPDIRRLGGQP